MKKITRILMICATIVAFGFTNPSEVGMGKMVDLTVKYSFKGIVDGYDHDCKTELYVDGKLVATSTVEKESKPNSVSAKIKKGTHDIKVVNYALYEGLWEAHTIENNYSQDCLYSATINCKKKSNTIELLFDIDNGTIVVE